MRQAYDYWQNQPGNNPKPSGREAHGLTPKGSGKYKAGRSKAASRCLLRGHTRRRRRKQPIQLPPLSSPRYSPRRYITSVTTGNNRHMCPSGGEDSQLPHHAHKERIFGRSIPKGLADRWQSHSSTNPERCLLEKRTGLQLPTVRTGAAPAALLHNIGLNLPEQTESTGPAPDNVPTRVNVASRYLGNKACKYGTTSASASNLNSEQYT